MTVISKEVALNSQLTSNTQNEKAQEVGHWMDQFLHNQNLTESKKFSMKRMLGVPVIETATIKDKLALTLSQVNQQAKAIDKQDPNTNNLATKDAGDKKIEM